MNDVDWLLKEKYHGEKTEGFFTDIERLKSGEPLAYIIGQQPFLKATIWLDSRPLIPRVETEFWIEKLIEEYKQSSTVPNKILDLCAGSGCIGVALALVFPKTHITFVEIDTHHHETIKKNCQLNNISEEFYTILGGDLFTKLGNQEFDLIVSNPPYINKELGRTEASVKAFEPELALYAKDNGLEIIKEIIKETPKHLTSAGQLWLEHEPEQVLAITEFAKTHFIIHTHDDQYRIKRFSKLMLQ